MVFSVVESDHAQGIDELSRDHFHFTWAKSGVWAQSWLIVDVKQEEKSYLEEALTGPSVVRQNPFLEPLSSVAEAPKAVTKEVCHVVCLSRCIHC